MDVLFVRQGNAVMSSCTTGMIRTPRNPATTHVQGQARAASERQARARHPSSGDMRHMHGRGSRRGTAVRPHAPRLRGNEWRISAPCFLQLSSLPGNRQTRELALGPGRGERRSGAICLVTGPALRRSPLFVVRMLLRNVLDDGASQQQNARCGVSVMKMMEGG